VLSEEKHLAQKYINSFGISKQGRAIHHSCCFCLVCPIRNCTIVVQTAVIIHMLRLDAEIYPHNGDALWLPGSANFQLNKHQVSAAGVIYGNTLQSEQELPIVREI
jgi:hypothetical protein